MKGHSLLSQVFVLIWQGLGRGSIQLSLVQLLLGHVDLDLWGCQSHLLHKVQVGITAAQHPLDVHST